MLSVERVAFAYDDGPPVLTDVSFAVAAGEVVAIVGRNGAGKSTLLRLLNGLRQPTGGRVLVEGNDTLSVSAPRLARHIGTVFQAPEQQIFSARVAEEVAFGPRQLRLPPAEVAARVERVLERTGLAAAAGKHPLDLDQAARRFVAIASVLAMGPRILLLDEPQRGLDAPAKALLERLITDEVAGGAAVIVVCHDMEFVARVASRVIALADGTVAADAPPRHFFADADAVGRAHVEVPDIVALAQALGLAPALTPAALAASLAAAREAQEARLT